MKIKLLTILLGLSTLTLGGLSFYYYLELDRFTTVIADRELTITNYKKAVNAIGRSGGISIDKLKTELKTEFDIDEKFGYADYSKEYYCAFYPKEKEINAKEIWEFMGLELILDEKKEFKTINLYKP